MAEQPPFNWQITAKKIVMDGLKVGAVYVSTQAAMLPDSYWAGIFAQLGLHGSTLLVATLVGIPALRGALNALKNW